jgi:hypothetical protein
MSRPTPAFNQLRKLVVAFIVAEKARAREGGVQKEKVSVL